MSLQVLNRLLCASSYLLITRSIPVTATASTEKAGRGSIDSVPFIPTAICQSNRPLSSNCQGEMSSKTSQSTSKDVEVVEDIKYVAGSSSVAFVTTPDENSAKKLARGVIEQKLAACVNIIPKIQSIYMWEGKVNEDNEYLLMIKTRSSRLEDLTKWVRENHPYSVAEVITLPIEKGNGPYLNWISETVPDKN